MQDHTTFQGELDCVANEVDEHLSKLGLIRFHISRNVRISFDLEGEPGALGWPNVATGGGDVLSRVLRVGDRLAGRAHVPDDLESVLGNWD